MMELQELRALGLAGAGPEGRPLEDMDLSSNWFSLQVSRGGGAGRPACR